MRRREEKVPVAVDASILFVTLDSCRYDTSLATQTPHIKALGPVCRAMAPGHFTYASRAAMFMGFTPGVAIATALFLNPKSAKFSKMVGEDFFGQREELILLRGCNIVDWLRRADYPTLGMAAMGWMNPVVETGRPLTKDFDGFFFYGNCHCLEEQLQ